MLLYQNDYNAQAKFAEIIKNKQKIFERIDKGWAIYEPLPQEPEEAEVEDESKEETEDEENNPLSLENIPKKEKFGKQDKDVVKTTDEDREVDKSDKMILAQEKLLSRMNKYKPLLDTLNGLTKNIAIVKGLSTSDKE
jgi:hypothetical protein